MKKLYGIGINDAGYVVSRNIRGVRVICPYYRTWATMLRRCYSDVYIASKPTYQGCSVCSDWIYFSKFKTWMETQDWKGKQLDKDLLFEGNKVYSPETCIFVPQLVNAFLTDRINHRGAYPIGVHRLPSGRFRSVCSEFGAGQTHLGVYSTPEEAHLAYKLYKCKLALTIASQQSDKRISEALIKRYS